MSKDKKGEQEPASGLAIAEKLIGLLIIVIGALITYNTYQNISNIGPNPGIFVTIGIMLVGLGLILLIFSTD
jgi:hypothetical protein